MVFKYIGLVSLSVFPRPFRWSIDAATGVHLWRKEMIGGKVAVAIVNYNDEGSIQAGLKLNLLEAGFSTVRTAALCW